MKIYTLRDAIIERQNSALNAKIDARVERDLQVAGILKSNPQIGFLVRDGKTVFYTYVNHYREAGKPEQLI